MKKASNIVLGILGLLLLIPSAWEEKAPDFETILGKFSKTKKNRDFSTSMFASKRKGVKIMIA